MAKPASICLACPRSCRLRPQSDDLPGQKLCPQGRGFLSQEEKEPLRHYFSTVRQADGQLYAYLTVQPVPLEAIENFCRKLAEAENLLERNRLHLYFCERYAVRLTCIDKEVPG